MDTLIYPGHGDVLALPQMYLKPSFGDLLQALQALEIKPPLWNQRRGRSCERGATLKETVDCLIRIISSALAWIPSDEDRELVWTLASRRLTERSGRSALPAMDRTWVIPASGDCPQISLCLHEPTLTGDDLGHKTWASSYLLSQKLSYIANAHFGEFNIHKVLELGSGTGLLGLAAAAILQCEATLTDLSPIIPNLIENATRNESVIGARGGTVRTEVLDWNQLSSSPIIGRFPLIIAADALYSDEQPLLLAAAVQHFLEKDSQARLLIVLPIRDKSSCILGKLWLATLAEYGICLIACERMVGLEDWEENGGTASVKCWWGLWRRFNYYNSPDGNLPEVIDVPDEFWDQE